MHVVLSLINFFSNNGVDKQKRKFISCEMLEHSWPRTNASLSLFGNDSLSLHHFIKSPKLIIGLISEFRYSLSRYSIWRLSGFGSPIKTLFLVRSSSMNLIITRSYRVTSFSKSWSIYAIISSDNIRFLPSINLSWSCWLSVMQNNYFVLIWWQEKRIAWRTIRFHGFWSFLAPEVDFLANLQIRIIIMYKTFIFQIV